MQRHTTLAGDGRRARPPRWRRARWPAASLALLVATALGVSACGGPVGHGVASIGATTTTVTASYDITAEEARFGHCMRAHGLPNYPDPVTTGTETRFIPRGYATGTAAFKAAWKACAKYLPGGGTLTPPKPSPQKLAAMLKFAKCMRAHGVVNFPDPRTPGAPPPEAPSVYAALHVPQAVYAKAYASCKGLERHLGTGRVHPCSMEWGTRPAGSVVTAIDPNTRNAIEVAVYEC